NSSNRHNEVRVWRAERGRQRLGAQLRALLLLEFSFVALSILGRASSSGSSIQSPADSLPGQAAQCSIQKPKILSTILNAREANAMRLKAIHALGKNLTTEEIGHLYTFLKSLPASREDNVL